MTVENTSDTDTVTITSLVDRIGQQERNLDGEGTCDVTPAIVLAPGATYGCSFTTTFTSNGPASQSDVVTASGTDDDGNPVGDSAGATVRITDVPSSIAVTKTPSVGSIQAPGGDVTFTVVVTNASAVDTVTVSSLSDSVYGELDDQGTCSVPQQLAPGQSYQCQFTGSVTGEGGQQHTNTVTAGGTDDDGEPVSGEATATVEITTPPPAAPAGGQAGSGDRPRRDEGRDDADAAERQGHLHDGRHEQRPEHGDERDARRPGAYRYRL